MEVSTSTAAFAVAALCGAVAIVVAVRARASTAAQQGIPWAAGGVPVLGHALAYAKDAPGFLTRTTKALGPIFRVDLAGKRMIVVAGTPYMSKVEVTAEATLSARDAIFEVGFGETLGIENVLRGTDLHKSVLKEVLSAGGFESLIPKLHAALSDAVREVFVKEQDLFNGVRRCMLRSTLRVLVRPSLEKEAVLLDRFMAFQDAVEEATASAAVLPRWLALPLILWPVARMRRKLARQLALLLEQPGQDGPWLLAMTGMPFETQAQFVIGLMFAAHKNPAIAAAQTFLFSHGDGEVKREASRFNEDPTLKQMNAATATRNHVHETLRLTAHSIGAIRKVRRDFMLGEFLVRRGETVAVSHIAPHLDTQIWGDDASEYRPSRFDKALLPLTTFSAGTHKCPGSKLAVALVHATLACLLEQGWEPPKTIPGLCFKRATLAQRAGPIRLRKRAPP